MILLTRMDKQCFFVNPDHIVSIEETPDTVITLFNDHHFIVRDSARTIINKIIAYKAAIIRRAGGGKTPGKQLAKSRLKHFRSCTFKSNIKPLTPGNSKHHLPLHGTEL